MPTTDAAPLHDGPSGAWTRAQGRLLAVFAEADNRRKPIKEIVRLAGYQDYSVWYKAVRDPRFVAALTVLGVAAARQPRAMGGVPHTEVTLAVDPAEELAKDIWDMRRLKADYPTHIKPKEFKVDFTILPQPLRRQVKDYFRLHLPRWAAYTFRGKLQRLRPCLLMLPAEVHMGTIERRHVEDMLPRVAQLSDSQAYSSAVAFKAMLEYMATSPAWTGPRPPRFLMWPEDVPPRFDTLPRPIPPDVVDHLEGLLTGAVEAMERGEPPDILPAIHGEALLILRRTGMRFEDVAHLKAPDAHGRGGCLVQDSQGYWWIRIEHTTTKMRRDHRIPTRASDGAIASIRRQAVRAAAAPDHYGEDYLFRTTHGILQYEAFVHALTKLAPHLMHEGQPYTITPHQFRHTIASEMIQDGVDVYTVKEFLGHKSLEMTQRYVAVYLSTLHARFMAYRAKRTQIRAACASPLIAPQVDATPREDADGGWVPGQVGSLYVSPLPNGIGLCRHLAMLDPCPTVPRCPFCPKLIALARHKPFWEGRVTHLRMTVDALGDNPQFHPARAQHQRELDHATYVIETIERKGHYDGRIDLAGSRQERSTPPDRAGEVGAQAPRGVRGDP